MMDSVKIVIETVSKVDAYKAILMAEVDVEVEVAEVVVAIVTTDTLVAPQSMQYFLHKAKTR